MSKTFLKSPEDRSLRPLEESRNFLNTSRTGHSFLLETEPILSTERRGLQTSFQISPRNLDQKSRRPSFRKPNDVSRFSSKNEDIINLLTSSISSHQLKNHSKSKEKKSISPLRNSNLSPTAVLNLNKSLCSNSFVEKKKCQYKQKGAKLIAKKLANMLTERLMVSFNSIASILDVSIHDKSFKNSRNFSLAQISNPGHVSRRQEYERKLHNMHHKFQELFDKLDEDNISTSSKVKPNPLSIRLKDLDYSNLSGNDLLTHPHNTVLNGSDISRFSYLPKSPFESPLSKTRYSKTSRNKENFPKGKNFDSTGTNKESSFLFKTFDHPNYKAKEKINENAFMDTPVIRIVNSNSNGINFKKSKLNQSKPPKASLPHSISEDEHLSHFYQSTSPRISPRKPTKFKRYQEINEKSLNSDISMIPPSWAKHSFLPSNDISLLDDCTSYHHSSLSSKMKLLKQELNLSNDISKKNFDSKKDRMMKIAQNLSHTKSTTSLNSTSLNLSAISRPRANIPRIDLNRQALSSHDEPTEIKTSNRLKSSVESFNHSLLPSMTRSKKALNNTSMNNYSFLEKIDLLQNFSFLLNKIYSITMREAYKNLTEYCPIEEPVRIIRKPLSGLSFENDNLTLNNLRGSNPTFRFTEAMEDSKALQRDTQQSCSPFKASATLFLESALSSITRKIFGTFFNKFKTRSFFTPMPTTERSEYKTPEERLSISKIKNSCRSSSRFNENLIPGQQVKSPSNSNFINTFRFQNPLSESTSRLNINIGSNQNLDSPGTEINMVLSASSRSNRRDTSLENGDLANLSIRKRYNAKMNESEYENFNPAMMARDSKEMNLDLETLSKVNFTYSDWFSDSKMKTKRSMSIHKVFKLYIVLDQKLKNEKMHAFYMCKNTKGNNKRGNRLFSVGTIQKNFIFAQNIDNLFHKVYRHAFSRMANHSSFMKRKNYNKLKGSFARLHEIYLQNLKAIFNEVKSYSTNRKLKLTNDIKILIGTLEKANKVQALSIKSEFFNIMTKSYENIQRRELLLNQILENLIEQQEESARKGLRRWIKFTENERKKLVRIKNVAHLFRILSKITRRRHKEYKEFVLEKINDTSSISEGLNKLDYQISIINQALLTHSFNRLYENSQKVQLHNTQKSVLELLYTIIKSKLRNHFTEFKILSQINNKNTQKIKTTQTLTNFSNILQNFLSSNLQGALKMIELEAESRHNMKKIYMNLVLKMIFLIKKKRESFKRDVFDRLASMCEDYEEKRYILERILARNTLRQKMIYFQRFKTELHSIQLNRTMIDTAIKSLKLAVEKLSKIHRDSKSHALRKLFFYGKSNSVFQTPSKADLLNMSTFNFEYNKKMIIFMDIFQKLFLKRKSEPINLIKRKMIERMEVLKNKVLFVDGTIIKKLFFKRKFLSFIQIKSASDNKKKLLSIKRSAHKIFNLLSTTILKSKAKKFIKWSNLARQTRSKAHQIKLHFMERFYKGWHTLFQKHQIQRSRIEAVVNSIREPANNSLGEAFEALRKYANRYKIKLIYIPLDKEDRIIEIETETSSPRSIKSSGSTNRLHSPGQGTPRRNTPRRSISPKSGKNLQKKKIPQASTCVISGMSSLPPKCETRKKSVQRNVKEVLTTSISLISETSRSKCDN